MSVDWGGLRRLAGSFAGAIWKQKLMGRGRGEPW